MEHSYDPQIAAAEDAQTSTVAIGVVMAVVGWAGLIWVILNTVPTVQYRWLGFALLHIAISGSVMPFVHYLNLRFARDDGRYVTSGIIVRQSMWFGVIGATAFWLAIPRLFSPVLVGVMAFALFVIEFLLRVRESTVYRSE